VGGFERYCDTEAARNPAAFGAKREFLLSESLPLFQEHLIASIPELQALTDNSVLVKLAS